MRHTLEGDLTHISELQLKFIIEVISKQSNNVNKVTFDAVGKPGDNFMSYIKRITIESENETVKLIAKFATTKESLRKKKNVTDIFANEHLMYTEIVPKFIQLQKDAGFPKEDFIKIPKCYGSSPNAPHEVLILEDCNESDYFLLNRFDFVSDVGMKSVLKNIARLHSLSHVLKQKEPETFESFKNKLFDFWAVIENYEEIMMLVRQSTLDALMVLDEPKHLNVVNNVTIDIAQFNKKAKEDEYRNKYSVVSHSDIWMNNILFKKVNNEIEDSILVDYQLARNGNAAYDVLGFIFQCSDYDLRRKHYFEWVDLYYSEVQKSLKYFGLKVEDLYPRQQFDKDLRKYAPYIFSFTLFTINISSRSGEDATALHETLQNKNGADASHLVEKLKMTYLNPDTVALYKEKLIENINSFLELGVLPVV